MKPSTLGATIGGAVAFFAIVAWKVFVITSPFLRAVLFPGSIFIKFARGVGPFPEMLLDSLAYLLDIPLYAIIGYAIGRWLSGAPSAAAEKEIQP